MIAQGVRTFCICVVSALRARLAGAIDSGIIAAFPPQADDLSSVPDPTASRRLGKCAAQLKCPTRNVQPMSNQRFALAMQNVLTLRVGVSHASTRRVKPWENNRLPTTS